MASQAQDLERYEQRLRSEEADAREHLAHAEQELEDTEQDGVPDNVDRAVQTTVRDEVLRRIERYRLHLGEVQRALGRIEAGTYGLCAVDGEPIEPARLEAIPWAEYCLAHQPESASPGDTPTL